MPPVVSRAEAEATPEPAFDRPARGETRAALDPDIEQQIATPAGSYDAGESAAEIDPHVPRSPRRELILDGSLGPSRRRITSKPGTERNHSPSAAQGPQAESRTRDDSDPPARADRGGAVNAPFDDDGSLGGEAEGCGGEQQRQQSAAPVAHPRSSS